MVVKRSSSKSATAKKSDVTKTSKKPSTKKAAATTKAKEKVVEETVKKSNRPEDERVTYAEQEYELREVPAQGNQVLIGYPRLTRFERARITGARSLQLSLGAPSLIAVPERVNDSISLATVELDSKALPISIRRILPNGLYQDIPIDWMK